MSFTYNAPTGLVGSNPVGLQVDLSWIAATPINGPSLLMHCDGVNGSTAFVDSSGNNAVLTTVSPAVIDTSMPEFGSGAMNLGTGFGAAGVTTPGGSASNFDMGSGDFTIEFRINMAANPGYNTYLLGDGFPNGANGQVGFVYSNTTGQISGSVNSGGSAYSALTSAIPLASWNAVALVRHGTTLSIYLNGVCTGSGFLGSVTIPSGALNAPVSTFVVGSTDVYANKSPSTEMDEIRVTKGAALYTANYTPATAAFSTAPPGYDIYRNGVSIATYAGAYTSYVDTVPANGVYTYTVAAYDGVSADLSAQSSPLVIAVPNGTVYVTAKFVAPRVSKAIMMANPGNINPRVYPPVVDVDARLPLPRLPL